MPGVCKRKVPAPVLSPKALRRPKVGRALIRLAAPARLPSRRRPRQLSAQQLRREGCHASAVLSRTNPKPAPFVQGETYPQGLHL
jgi:hypothetical protein